MRGPVIPFKLSDGTPESELRVRMLWWYYVVVPRDERKELTQFYLSLISPFVDVSQWPKDNLFVIMDHALALDKRVALSSLPPLSNPLSQEEYAAGYVLLFNSLTEWADDYGFTIANNPTVLALTESLREHLPAPDEYLHKLESHFAHLAYLDLKSEIRNAFAAANGMNKSSDKEHQPISFARVNHAVPVRLNYGSPESELRVRTLWWYYMHLPEIERAEFRKFYRPLCHPLEEPGPWPMNNMFVILELDSLVANHTAPSSFPHLANPLTQEEYEAGYKLVFKMFFEWSAVHWHGEKDNENYEEKDLERSIAKFGSLKRYLPLPELYTQVLTSSLEAIDRDMNGQGNAPDKGQQQTKRSLLNRLSSLFKH